MKFRTAIKSISAKPKPINFESKSLFLGSCFAENFAAKFDYLKLANDQNPYGILYNPWSIAKIFQDLKENKSYTAEDLVPSGEVWTSLNHHSRFNHLKSEDVVLDIQSAIEELKNNKGIYTHVFISLGTAWIYRFLQTDRYVANCHKIPASEFEKNLLSLEEINTALKQIISSFSNEVQFTLTLSPVRHIKDGVEENALSKSLLRVAIDQIVKEYTNVCYFPSYEIMIDDLRDYRFYERDLVHPREEAIDYIWDIFEKAFFDKKTQQYLKQITEVQKGLAHRPFNPNSESNLLFKRKIELKIKSLENDLGVKLNLK